MNRKLFQTVLLLIVLVPALTGWAGDSCCPADESRCASSCAGTPLTPGHGDGHEDTDPGHQQAVCGCSCHALSLSVSRITLPDPPCLGTLDPPEPGDPSSAHFAEIFRPPLA